jgi:serine/threonine protein kinase
MNVVGISPLDWNLKLQIACDLAHAMYQCHVRFAFCSSFFFWFVLLRHLHHISHSTLMTTLQDQSVVHSDFCCCNILFRIEQLAWTIKVANVGVLPAVSSIISRRAYLAPELLLPLNLHAYATESAALCPRAASVHFDPTASNWRSPFTQESDVFSLGITLLQLFRHTLFDCNDVICAAAANQTHIAIPLFPPHSIPLFFPNWLSSIQGLVLSCTAFDPKKRPSALDVRFAHGLLLYHDEAHLFIQQTIGRVENT